MDSSYSCFWRVRIILTILYISCNDNFQFSGAQTLTPATTGTVTSNPTTGCNVSSQCFLNQTQLDPLLNCTFDVFGETDPPCYGHWTTASSCSCNEPFYRISSDGGSYWCIDDGNWESTLYALQCFAPCVTDADEEAIPRNSDGNVTVIITDGDFVKYSCPNGYVGSGSQTVDCKDGTWEPHEPFTCTKLVNDATTLFTTTIPETTVPRTTKILEKTATPNIDTDSSQGLSTANGGIREHTTTTSAISTDFPGTTQISETTTIPYAETDSTWQGSSTANGGIQTSDSATELFSFPTLTISTDGKSAATPDVFTTLSSSTKSAKSTKHKTTPASLTTLQTQNLSTSNTSSGLTTESSTTTDGTTKSTYNTSDLFTTNATLSSTVGFLTTLQTQNLSTLSTNLGLTTESSTTTNGTAYSTLNLFTTKSNLSSTVASSEAFQTQTTDTNTASTSEGSTTANGTTISLDTTTELFTSNARPMTTAGTTQSSTNITEILTFIGTSISASPLLTTQEMTTTPDCNMVFNSTGSNFTSPGYPNDYGYNIYCAYTAEALPGNVIELSFASFAIYKTDLCKSHYVAVYDGGTSEDEEIARFCGEEVPYPVYSTGNTMFVTFKTNSEGAVTYQGFEATFSFIEVSLLPPMFSCDMPDNAYIDDYKSEPVPNGHTAVLECSNGYLPSTGTTDLHQCANGTIVPSFDCILNCSDYFDTSPSTFSSPGYPVHEYENNLKCSYQAEAPPGSIVILTFLDVDIEQHPTCEYDYVSVYDGSTEDVEQISRICGDIKPFQMYSTGRYMLVVFRSDHSVTKKGFEASFTFVNESSIPPEEPCLVPENAVYVSDDEDPLNSRHTAVIKCNDGFLPPEPESRQCVNGTFQPYLQCNSTGCTSYFTTSPSYFTSPGYPSYYQYMTCFYSAEAPTGDIVSLEFTSFEMNSYDMLCSNDYVSVYDGNSTQDDPIAKFCGDVIPETVYSTGNIMTVLITTDYAYYDGEVGFEANFTFISNTSIPPTESCYPPQNGSFVDYIEEEVLHGHTVIVECESGFLPAGKAIRQCVNGTFYPVPDCNSTGCLEHFTSSPSFFSSPGSQTYDPYLSCSYSVESPPGYIVELIFAEFEIDGYPSSLCQSDAVSVFDGSSVENEHIATLCGSNIPCAVHSSGNNMLITFNTDRYTSRSGFAAVLTFVENYTVPYNENCFPPEFAHFVAESSESVPHGYTAILECDEGFIPTERVLLQCCNGTFTPSFECQSEITTVALTTLITTESVSTRAMSTSPTTRTDATSPEATTSSGTTTRIPTTTKTTILQSTTGRMSTLLDTTLSGSTESLKTTPQSTAAATTSATTSIETTTLRTLPDTTVIETTISIGPSTTATSIPPEITTIPVTILRRTTKLDTTTMKSSTVPISSSAILDTTLVATTTEVATTSIDATTDNKKTTSDITTRTTLETTLFTTVLTTIDPCNIEFNMTESSFKSPGNGSYYDNNLSCFYSATAPQGKIVVLSFETFSVQKDPLCRFDVLKVYNGLSTESHPIAMFCGFDVPEPVVSLGREMLVTFTSNEVDSYEGFQAAFMFVDESNLPTNWDCSLPADSHLDGKEESLVPHSHTAVLKCNEGFEPQEAVNSQCINGTFNPPLVCFKGELYLQRRYILPHLTSSLEPINYYLGFMDTNLSNTTFIRVQPSTDGTFSDFYGGVLNTLEYTLPGEFNNTRERSTLEIQSTDDVHLYISTANFRDQFLCYPIEWLGTDYIIGTSPSDSQYSFIITATELDTKVSIFFPKDFNLDGVTYNFEEDLRRTLYELQSFSVKTPFDPSGTYIKSSKRIAVMMELRPEDDGKSESCYSSFYIPPINSWGLAYSFGFSTNTTFSFSITAAYTQTMVKIVPQSDSCGKGTESFQLDSWSKRDFNDYHGCRINVTSNQSIFVLVTEYSSNNFCNTYSVPPIEAAIKSKPGVPIFASADSIGSNLRVWISNSDFNSLQVDGDQSYEWDVIGEMNKDGSPTIVETMVESGYHVISSTNEEAHLLITIDRKLYAAYDRIEESTNVCPFDRLFYSGVELTFKATFSGSSAQAIEVCNSEGASQVKANQSLATRNCTNGSWDEPSLTECYEDVPEALEKIANENVTEENVDEIARDVALLTSQTEELSPTEVDNAAESLEAIAETGSTSPDVTDSVVGTVNNLMEIEEDTLAEADDTSTVITSLEQQVSNVQKNPDNFTEVEDNVGVKAVKIDPEITKAITFANLFNGNGSSNEGLDADLKEENTVLFNDKEEVRHENSVTSIFLPPKILQIAENATSSRTKLPFSFFIYKNSRLFQTNMLNETDEGNLTIRDEVVSQVITAKVEIEDLVIDNLPPEDAVIARFSTADVVGSDVTILDRTCVFWVVDKNSTTGSWSGDGCTITNDTNNDEEIVCHCTHLTSFAVIFRVGNGSKEYQEEVSLNLITRIGTTLSVIGLIACILTLTLIKKLRVKQPTKIHINLCLCLIGFYVSFLAGDLAIGKDPHCWNIATASHFFCLTTIAWTCAEAVNMYFLFVKYSRSTIKYFIPVSCALCYGLSLVPALLVHFLDKTGKNGTEVTMEYCFLHPGPSLYYGLLLEILIMILFNIVVFTLVVRRVIFRPMLSTNAQNNKKEEIVARIQQFILFWVLLGLSWTFGFLLAIPNKRPKTLEILFCIFISLQGFILFLFICVKNPEIRRAFKKTTKRRFTKKEGYQMKDLPGSSSLFSDASKTNPKLKSVKSSKRHLVADSDHSGISDSGLTNTHSTFTGTDFSEGEDLVSTEKFHANYETINTGPNMTIMNGGDVDEEDTTENGSLELEL